MSKDALHDRGKALEEKFFADRDRELITALKDDLRRHKAEEELAAYTGITDADLLLRLVDLGVTAHTFAAFHAVPLLHVAWADRRLDKEEADAILTEAHAAGIPSDSATYKLLGEWLGQDPDTSLFPAWRDYQTAIASHLSPEEHDRLKAGLLEQARRIARASGGLLGLGATSSEERHAIQDLEDILG